MTRQWYIHQDSYIYSKIRIYTSRFVYIHQDSYIYIKIRIYTLRFVYIHQDLYIYIKIRVVRDIKESMTAGSIIVFSNGDRKMAANEEAIFSLRVYRAMTGEMTPASNVKEELSRVFSRVGAQQPLLCNPRVNYRSNGSSGKNGRLKPTSWKGTQQKRACIVSLCDTSTTALRHCREQHSFN